MTVNPGRNEAEELKKMLEAMVIHTSNEPTLKVVSSIIKDREDVVASTYEPKVPNTSEYANRIEVLLMDSKGNPKKGVDGNNIVVEELHVFDSEKKEMLWGEYDRMRKRAIDKDDKIKEGKEERYT